MKWLCALLKLPLRQFFVDVGYGTLIVGAILGMTGRDWYLEHRELIKYSCVVPKDGVVTGRRDGDKAVCETRRKR